MSREEAAKLAPGLYRVYWKTGGGTSLAAIGQRRGGGMWLAPANWLTPDTDTGKHWRSVDRVELIRAAGTERTDPA
jgi:hypothetical protein